MFSYVESLGLTISDLHANYYDPDGGADTRLLAMYHAMLRSGEHCGAFESLLV